MAMNSHAGTSPSQSWPQSSSWPSTTLYVRLPRTLLDRSDSLCLAVLFVLNTSIKEKLDLFVCRDLWLQLSELGQFCFEAGRDAQRHPDSLFAHRGTGGKMDFSLTYGAIMMHYDAIKTPLVRSSLMPKTNNATLVRQNRVFQSAFLSRDGAKRPFALARLDASPSSFHLAGRDFVHRRKVVRDARGSPPDSSSRAMLWNPHRSARATVRPRCGPVGF